MRKSLTNLTFVLLAAWALMAAYAGPAAGQQAGQRVFVRNFEFSGVTAMKTEDLARAVADFQGRELTLEEIKAAADSVSAAYHEQGFFLARAALPEQDISGGVVRIHVFEGKLGKVIINGDAGYSTAFLTSYFNGVRNQGVIRKRDMERALLLISELPGMKMQSLLQAGAEQGETDIVLTVEKGRSAAARFSVDNFGSQFARVRAHLGADVMNRLGRGSMFSMSTVRSVSSNNLYYYSMSYAAPINARGLSFGMYGLAGDFGVGKEFAVLDIQGRASSMGMYFAQTLAFNEEYKTSMQLGLDARNSKQNILGFTSSKDEIRSLRLGWQRSSQTRSGRTFLALSLHKGLGEALGGMSTHDPLSSRAHAGADNDFFKLTYEYGRARKLGPKSMLVMRLSGQQSGDSLVVGEQMAIGGVDSVRGYPQAEYLGDSGTQASLEARFSPSEKRASEFQVATFVDWGRVSVKVPALGQDKNSSITGAGLGFRYSPGNGYFVRTDVGFPLGKDSSDGRSAVYYLQFSKSSND